MYVASHFATLLAASSLIPAIEIHLLFVEANRMGDAKREEQLMMDALPSEAPSPPPMLTTVMATIPGAAVLVTDSDVEMDNPANKQFRRRYDEGRAKSSGIRLMPIVSDLHRGSSINFYGVHDPSVLASWASFFRDQYLMMNSELQKMHSELQKTKFLNVVEKKILHSSSLEAVFRGSPFFEATVRVQLLQTVQHLSQLGVWVNHLISTACLLSLFVTVCAIQKNLPDDCFQVIFKMLSAGADSPFHRDSNGHFHHPFDTPAWKKFLWEGQAGSPSLSEMISKAHCTHQKRYSVRICDAVGK